MAVIMVMMTTQRLHAVSDELRRRSGWGVAQLGCGAARRAIRAVLLVLLVAGCAPMQLVPLSLQPAPQLIYVDGELLADGAPRQLELRADEAHVLFFKKEGYQPVRVVLESRQAEDGGARLYPDEITVLLMPLKAQGRSLQVEVGE